MNICSFYKRGRGKERRASVRAYAKTIDVATADISNHASFLDAVAEAVELRRKNKAVALVGALEDMDHPDTGDEEIGDPIWRESVIALLEENNVAYHFIDLTEPESDGTWKHPQGLVIRQYTRALGALRGEISSRLQTAERHGIIGRPPYGYRVQDGVLKVDPPKAEAVAFIFKRLQEGAPPYLIVSEARDKFPKNGTKKQFWDDVKIRRIFSRARLYCLGEYSCGGQGTQTFPDLAFLPKEWADTAWTSTHPVAQAATT